MDENYLKRKHVRVKDGQFLVALFWSKMLQLGERVLKMPLLSIPGSSICLVKAMAHMLILVPGKGDTPLFVNMSGKPITYQVYLKILKGMITKIRLNSQNYSTHSF